MLGFASLAHNLHDRQPKVYRQKQIDFGAEITPYDNRKIIQEIKIFRQVKARGANPNHKLITGKKCQQED